MVLIFRWPEEEEEVEQQDEKPMNGNEVEIDGEIFNCVGSLMMLHWEDKLYGKDFRGYFLDLLGRELDISFIFEFSRTWASITSFKSLWHEM